MPAPTVLILLPHWLPGTRYGGPVRTVRNLAARLGGEYRFFVLSSDRDFGATVPYDLPTGRWLEREDHAARHEPRLDGAGLARIVDELRPDLVQLNSLFHPRWSILPAVERRRGLWAGRLAIAVRGELNPGALAIKPAKKRAWLAFAKAAGVYRDVDWQASSEAEAEAVRRVFGARARVFVAPNLTAPLSPLERAAPKERGRLRALFLGRVSAMKNPDWLLERLAAAGGPVELTVAGPVEDEALAARCRRLAAALPAGSVVDWRGDVPPEELPALLAGHDLLTLPSRGENHGHAIVEALQQGLPVLISDRTPWRGLPGARAGWDLPLEEPAAYEERLRAVRAMDHEEWAAWSAGARALGERISADPAALEANRRLLDGVLP